MIVSMTGYGYESINNELFKVTVEMKSINHRFTEIMVRMPRQYMSIEDKIKKIVSQYVKRGKVDVFVTIEGQGLFKRSLEVDWDLLEQYTALSDEVKAKYNIQDNLTLQQLLLHPEIVSINEQESGVDTVQSILLEATQSAAAKLYKMREREGLSLYEDLKGRIHKLSSITEGLVVHAPKVIESYQERLLKRVTEFLEGKLEMDESRIMTEVAVFADKANIDEELTRLKSHLQQFLLNIENSGVVGRKLDFLVQEMNREMNTIGSKANDLHISKQVVELKSELEKIKEQVQNIE
ncbi:YicC/YloC family endoribonuclease [Anaerobacillus sp. MEB173]|uniref:YicC/YloC family endoribonuclease n=1 Tax=Anaerobacillus sp. MEB173 TaxID=3383345 RepID=UPI003F8F6F57